MKNIIIVFSCIIVFMNIGTGTCRAKAVSISPRGEIKDDDVLINSVTDNGMAHRLSATELFCRGTGD